jgi:hypothetical protein
MLRRWLIGLGVLYLLGALLLFAAFGAVIPGIYLLVGGAVLLGGIVFERSRYRPRIDRERGDWQTTGERFVDPSSGRLVDVRYNPATGQRDYVDAEAGDGGGGMSPR